MRVANLLMSAMCVVGMLGLIFGGEQTALTVKAHCGSFACDVSVFLGLVLTGVNGAIAGNCVVRAVAGEERDQ